MASVSDVATAIKTTKSGINMENFEDVSLVKEVPQVAAVISIEDALARLNNDATKLFAVITNGLNSLAVEEARKSDSGWKIVDENGKVTDQEFSGTLVSSEILNPMVLALAKLNHGFDEIAKGDQSAELKRAAKEKALEDIKNSPVILEGLKRKMAAAK